MTETTKEYNNYLAQIGMVIHPNLLNAFMKIHNKLIEEAVAEAKQVKPSKEWFDLKETVERMKNSELSFRKLYVKQILKDIEKLPKNERW